MPPERPTLSAVTIAASDLDRSLAFYDAVLGALGLRRVAELVDEEEDDASVEAVGWGPDDGPAVLWVVAAEQPTTGLHLRLQADSPPEVEAFFAAGVARGGQARQAPRPWTLYRRGEFGAMVADPDHNVIEAVAAD